jgi:hypothetical protein
MVGKIIVAVLSLSLALTAPVAFAAPSKDPASTSKTNGPRRHLTTIVMAGLAGAILGLSTLSFYGRPQDRLSNVPVGFAIGVIIGATYTTYKAAAEPKDFYSVRDPQPELWKVATSTRVDHPPAPRASAVVFNF